MASFVYDKWLENRLTGAGPNITSTTVKAYLVHTGSGHYVVSQSTDQFLSSIVSGDRLSSFTLSSKTVTGGVFDAADGAFPLVGGTDAGGAIVIVRDTGTDTTSELMAYIDNYSGLPVTPNGQDINVVWANDSNKIYKV